MKKVFAVVFSLLQVNFILGESFYDLHFKDSTLRLDYTLNGDNRHQQVNLEGVQSSPGWYGRRVNLDCLLLEGNAQLVVTDTTGVDTLYRQSFSTLFQEWQTTEEATKVRKSFEHVVLMPFPQHAVLVMLSLYDTHRVEKCRLTHKFSPDDILIRSSGERWRTPWRYIRKSGDSKDCIDVAFVAEGYTEQELDVFYRDCELTVEAIASHEPFKSEIEKFNFIGVASPSIESGVSIPHKGIWVNTTLSSSYDTFYSERYLTTLRLFDLHDLLMGIPYEHIVILVNTNNYGGGGIYNNYLMSAAHHPTARVVAVHEFGHSFAGLADEYFYDDQYEPMYPPEIEPWEPNITTLVDFDSKWKDMLPLETAIPTIADGKDVYDKVGVYEGAGYQSHGIYRPVQECRMKTNEAREFCPVCQRAIQRVINWQTIEIGR